MSERQAQVAGGRIEVICGCMFAGKTARLIEELLAARTAGHVVMAFKHELDARYDNAQLATHDHRRFAARAVPNAAELVRLSLGAQVVGLDEAHFFGRPLIAACQTMRDRGQRVILVGLDYDMWGQPLTPLPELKDIADRVDVLHTACAVCGQPARHSQRMVPIISDDVVGGPAEYEPRCRDCFEPLTTPAPKY
ncbi:MAG: thymidine kinase [Planctomycetota bacterium]